MSVPERRRYVITDDGIGDVERWLTEPAPPEPDLQSELFAKVVLELASESMSTVRPRMRPTSASEEAS